MSWFCRFVRLSTGAFVRSLQLGVANVALCCSTKFAEGICHKRTGPWVKGFNPKTGAEIVRRTQIPPLEGAANTTLPAAAEATGCQGRPEALFDTQAVPACGEAS